MYKAIFTDIDGTLRNDKEEISQRTIEAIKKVTKKGILVILCSGRPRNYTEELSRYCHASQYIITSNGGNIYDYKKDEVLYRSTMDKKELMKLYQLAEERDIRFILNVDEGRVVNKLKHPEEEQQVDDIPGFIMKHDIEQCIFADKDFDKIKNLIPEIKKLKKVEIKNQHKSLTNPDFPRVGSIYCDIANIESSKGNAVKKFCEILHIDLKDTIAIGDDMNDVSMFQAAGCGVAMGNASDQVKQYANQVILSNNKDGVAVFLEKLLEESREEQ